MISSPAPSPVAPKVASNVGAAKEGGVRADIQALRAIAVGSVLIYHLWPGGLSGGYVGVDVFFAISGYLITTHLLAEIKRTGRLRPGRFWARRVKRLMPASTIVLLFSTLSIVLWVPRYLWKEFLQEIVASSLQIENWLLARNAVDYLAANNVAAPTQHYWTLGVEEQFYVALPLILLVTSAVCRRWRIDHDALILVCLTVIVTASLLYSIHLTQTTPGVAYVSTFTRAWEFGGGALLAVVGVSRRTHRLLTWIGAAAIVGACLFFDAKTPFPGYAAALPVAGTLLVIWSGQQSSFDRVGTVAPIAFLGRISYATYLWHWPLIIVVPFITQHPLTTKDKLYIVVATLIAAWISTKFIEDPVRFNARLLGGRRPLVVGACGVVAVAVVLSFAGAALHNQSELDALHSKTARQVLAKNPKCLGAQAMDPKLKPCVNHALDGLLLPQPAQASADDDNLAACWLLNDAGQPNVCEVGPATGYTKRLLAVGDSHNNNLIGVYRRIAEKNHWRIDISGEGGCYVTSADQSQTSQGATDACESWRAAVTTIANDGDYTAIVVTHSARDRQVIPNPGETLDQATVRGLVGAWNKLPQVPIVAIRDNPAMPTAILGCVSDHPADSTQFCAQPRSVALGLPDGQAEAALQVPRAHVVDLSSFYCTATLCPPVIGNVLVYRDPSHITASFAETLTPYIEQQVVSILGH